MRFVFFLLLMTVPFWGQAQLSVIVNNIGCNSAVAIPSGGTTPYIIVGVMEPLLLLSITWDLMGGI